MSDDEVRRCVLGVGRRHLTEIVALHRPRWLEHVWLMPAHRPFVLAGQRWNKQHSGQAMTWHSGMKSASALASVSAFLLCGWDPRDADCSRLEMLIGMAQNRSQWRHYDLSVELVPPKHNSKRIEKPQNGQRENKNSWFVMV